MSERIDAGAETNRVWQETVNDVYHNYDNIVSPRGMEVREKSPGHYQVPMPAYIDLAERKVNVPFMFGEAKSIISGSNLTKDFSQHMKGYARYSDDGVFMRGSYGPKIVDQLGYVVDSLEADHDSRQAVLNIWRERPGPSKDIPCTTNMQFLIRDQTTLNERGEEVTEPKLNMISTMRSNDAIFGFTYDVFTFSMVAKSVQLLLRERGVNAALGNLAVNAGSLHIYETHYDKADTWTGAEKRDQSIGNYVRQLDSVETYEQLVHKLGTLASYAHMAKHGD